MQSQSEYAALKTEQLERIKQRDTFLNLAIVAVGLAAGFSSQADVPSIAWLSIPWVSMILGWAYLSNDDKVSAIGWYLRETEIKAERVETPTWETSAKGYLPPTLRTIADAMVFLIAFVFPTPAAIAIYTLTDTGIDHWPWGIRALVFVQVLLISCLATLYALSLWGRKRGRDWTER